MLEHIKAGWEAHTSACDQTPKAVLFNPGNHELNGWDEVLGLPVLPDESVAPKRFKLVCGAGRAGYCDDGDVIWDEDGQAHVYVPATDAAA